MRAKTDEELELRAGDARMLLEHPLLVEAFHRMENDAIDASVDVSDAVDDAMRFKNAVKVNVIRDVRTELQMILLENKHKASRGR